MRHVLTFLTALLLLLGASATQAIAQSAADTNATLDDLFGDHAPYQAFFEKLKTAVAADDKETVAAMVDYPFQARIDDRAIKIKDRKHFVSDYETVITPEVKQAVAQQTYGTLFANWQGVMIGDGEIWFSGIGDDNKIKIIAIND
ncbi:MAG: hypothetical protein ACPW61_02020 [Methyloligella sp. ZOD6]